MTSKQNESLNFLSLTSTVVFYLLGSFAWIILIPQARLIGFILTGIGLIIALKVMIDTDEPTHSRAQAAHNLVVRGEVRWTVTEAKA